MESQVFERCKNCNKTYTTQFMETVQVLDHFDQKPKPNTPVVVDERWCRRCVYFAKKRSTSEASPEKS